MSFKNDLDRRRLAMRRCGLMLALASSLCGPTLAQTEVDRIAELERKLERSVQQLARLGARVQELEAGRAAEGERSAAAVKPERSGSSAAAPPAPVSEIAALAAGLAVHGFADVGFAAGSKGRPVGGQVGSFDLYMTPQFGERAKGLVELVFEVGRSGALAVDLERLQFGYAFSDALTLWAGRFHTPLGFWNTAFHHGQQLQTAITRPRFLDFEDAGGVLPAHTVGVWGSGAFNLPAGRLSYDVYMGNAPTIDMEDPNRPGSGVLNPGMAGAGARSASIGANVSLRLGGALDGLTLGLHALRSKVADTLAAPNRSRLALAGGWLSYDNDDWELLAELYRFRNVELGSGAARSSRASYLQIGRSFGDWTPYTRVERTAFDQSDPYFAQQESGASYSRDVLGVRYELTPTMALKVEGQRMRFHDRSLPSYSELRSQLAVRF